MIQSQLSEKLLKATSSRADKDLSYKRAQAGEQCVLVEHQPLEQGQLKSNQPGLADERGPACTS